MADKMPHVSATACDNSSMHNRENPFQSPSCSIRDGTIDVSSSSTLALPAKASEPSYQPLPVFDSNRPICSDVNDVQSIQGRADDHWCVDFYTSVGERLVQHINSTEAFGVKHNEKQLSLAFQV